MAEDSAVSKDLLRPIVQEIIELKIAPIRTKIDNLAESVKDLQDFVSFANAKYDDHSKEIKGLVADLKDLKREKSILQQTIFRISNELKQYSDMLNDYEQYSRRECIEIRGIPENPHQQENTDEIVTKVAELMDVPLNEQDISISHRLPQPADSKFHPTIIAKFTSRKARDRFYKGRNNLKNKTTKDLGFTHKFHNKIYITESLTKKNQDLFKKCLSTKKEKRYQSIWTNNGKIYIRKDQESRPFVIKSYEDLDDLCYS